MNTNSRGTGGGAQQQQQQQQYAATKHKIIKNAREGQGAVLLVNLASLISFSKGGRLHPSRVDKVAGSPRQHEATLDGMTLHFHTHPFADFFLKLCSATFKEVVIFATFGDLDLLDLVLSALEWKYARLVLPAMPSFVAGTAAAASSTANEPSVMFPPIEQRGGGSASSSTSATYRRSFESFGWSADFAVRTCIVDCEPESWHQHLQPIVFGTNSNEWPSLLFAASWLKRIVMAWKSGAGHSIINAAQYQRAMFFRGVHVCVPRNCQDPSAIRLAMAHGAVVSERCTDQTTHVVEGRDADGNLVLPSIDSHTFIVSTAYLHACLESGTMLPAQMFPPSERIDAAYHYKPLNSSRHSVELSSLWNALSTVIREVSSSTPGGSTSRPSQLQRTTQIPGWPSSVSLYGQRDAKVKACFLAGTIVIALLVPGARSEDWFPIKALQQVLGDLHLGLNDDHLETILDHSLPSPAAGRTGTSAANLKRQQATTHVRVTATGYMISRDGCEAARADSTTSKPLDAGQRRDMLLFRKDLFETRAVQTSALIGSPDIADPGVGGTEASEKSTQTKVIQCESATSQTEEDPSSPQQESRRLGGRLTGVKRDRDNDDTEATVATPQPSGCTVVAVGPRVTTKFWSQYWSEHFRFDIDWKRAAEIDPNSFAPAARCIEEMRREPSIDTKDFVVYLLCFPDEWAASQALEEKSFRLGFTYKIPVQVFRSPLQLKYESPLMTERQQQPQQKQQPAAVKIPPPTPATHVQPPPPAASASSSRASSTGGSSTASSPTGGSSGGGFRSPASIRRPPGCAPATASGVLDDPLPPMRTAQPPPPPPPPPPYRAAQRVLPSRAEALRFFETSTGIREPHFSAPIKDLILYAKQLSPNVTEVYLSNLQTVRPDVDVFDEAAKLHVFS